MAGGHRRMVHYWMTTGTTVGLERLEQVTSPRRQTGEGAYTLVDQTQTRWLLRSEPRHPSTFLLGLLQGTRRGVAQRDRIRP